MTPEPQHGQAGTWRYLCLWKEDQQSIDLGATLGWLPDNDTDAAGAIALEFHDELHYLKGTDTWHIWDGTCHRPDTSNEVPKLAIRWVARYEDALKHIKGTDRAAFARTYQGDPAGEEAAFEKQHQKQWAGRYRYVAMLKGNTGLERLCSMLAKVRAASPSYLDERHPEWLNFSNCTVDLRTGQTRLHDPADLLSYALSYQWDPDARCPLFGELTWRVANYDQAAWEYLIKVLGYSLLGDNREQQIWFLKGPTKSGKSALLSVVRALLGTLATDSTNDLICICRHGRNARVENSIRGKRLVTIQESKASARIDPDQVKRLTGERRITVDRHYAVARLDTPVTWTIIQPTNELPALPDFDDAMAERTVVIPAGPTIPKEQRDNGLPERILATEAEGVLVLLVKACGQYLCSGLAMPLAVKFATDDYRGTQDTTAAFISERCILAPGS